MTWSKKLNSRAYDPIQACVLTPAAGSISAQTILQAHYTVVNDYFCIFNVHIKFTQAGSTSVAYTITLPLAFSPDSPAFGSVGSGSIYNATALTEQGAFSIRNNTGSSFTSTVPVAISVGANNEIKIAGQFVVR